LYCIVVSEDLLSKRYRIAALFSDFIFPFHRENFAGISSAAAEYDIDLHAIVCGSYKSPENFISMRNVLYELIDPSRYDGFIIPFSALSQYVSPESFYEYLSPILSKPYVLIGVDEKEHSCVLPDYASGVYRLVMHLAEEHSTDSFVYVRGPEDHISSNIREEGLRRALKESGISEDKLLIMMKPFMPECTGEIADEIERTGGITPRTAIIFVGEDMAVAMIHELKKRGYIIPENVIVCGTSGTMESRNCIPSVTTVENHFDTIGRRAVETLLEHFKEGFKPSTVLTDVELVTRQSCGCIAMDDPEIISPERIIALGSMVEKQMEESSDSVISSSSLYDAVHMLFPGERGRFFFSALELSLASFKDHAWQRTELALYNHLHLFRQIGNSLITEFNLPELFTRLKDRLGIQHCFLSEYYPPGKAGNKMRLLQAYRYGEDAKIDEVDSIFDAKGFFPENLQPDIRSTFVIEPVFYEDQQLGILALDLGENNVLVHEAICAQISGALTNRNQRDEIISAEQRFNDLAHSSSDWLWEIDIFGRISFSSGAIDGILEYSSVEMMQNSFFDYMFPSDALKCSQLKKKMLEFGEHVQRVEVESTSRSGRPLMFELSGRPVRGKKGELAGYRGVCKDITAAKEAEAKITTLALYDALTGLPNRKLYTDRLELITNQCRRSRLTFGVMFLDLDNFKKVNDTYGHEKGDELLVEAAKLFQSCLRDGDSVGRFGGDEFVFVIPEVQNESTISIVAERIVKKFRAKISSETAYSQVTTSIGIALYPSHGETPQDLMKNADAAMYVAKNQGKNRFVIFKEGMSGGKG
jgi:diguanylate cyclase (GGDEF)-like protein/PAS domain S-box-containing protein